MDQTAGIGSGAGDTAVAAKSEKAYVAEWLDALLAEEVLREEGRSLRERVAAAKEQREQMENALIAAVPVVAGVRTFVIDIDGRQHVVRVSKKGPTLVPSAE